MQRRSVSLDHGWRHGNQCLADTRVGAYPIRESARFHLTAAPHTREYARGVHRHTLQEWGATRYPRSEKRIRRPWQGSSASGIGSTKARRCALRISNVKEIGRAGASLTTIDPITAFRQTTTVAGGGFLVLLASIHQRRAHRKCKDRDASRRCHLPSNCPGVDREVPGLVKSAGKPLPPRFAPHVEWFDWFAGQRSPP